MYEKITQMETSSLNIISKANNNSINDWYNNFVKRKDSLTHKFDNKTDNNLDG